VAAPFLAACRREPAPFTPVWLMRQAGRYMPEYRAVRDRLGFLGLCKDPEAAAEVTVTAAERLGVDAAIVFSDILLVLEPLDVGLEYGAADGPAVRRPVRTAAEVARLVARDPPAAPDHTARAVARARAALPARLPLIGFAGAPFTLATYLVEGGPSATYAHTKTLMWADPGAWDALLGWLGRLVAASLAAQIAAGADAVQLFDSWVGCLSADDYRQHVLPHVRATLGALPAGTPAIHFGTGTAGLLEAMRAAGGDVLGLDWRVDLDAAWARVGHDVAVQGNLDPTVLLAPPAEIRARVAAVLGQAAGRPGHVFNLGHGVLPETPVDHVRVLVDAVHELSAR
jgi:uroporphyrinogen decarboxylase